jgi:hypothetical protein
MIAGFWYYDGSGRYAAESADDARKHAIEALDALRDEAAGEIWADWTEDIGWGEGKHLREHARERIVKAHACDHPHCECDEGECDCEVPSWCDAITEYDMLPVRS